ncbi:MAG: TIGR03032 family protein [Planctomycetes bacterium]|nr:TIGR03032 family protein [Planctomycetota bacterium]
MSDTNTPPPEAPKFQYAHSPSFPVLLEQLGISLAVTTYQAGKLMLVRAEQGRVSTLLRSFEQPMGLALSERLDRLIVGTRRMVWTLASAPEIAPQIEPPGRHDACFVPRAAHVTGDIRGHEIALAGGKIWIANTLLSCLCTLDDERYGFVPRWRPPFVDRMVAEDRCHLNGLAADDGRIRFVTALGATNTADGWKENKVQGGVLIAVASGELVARELCMPHSPRCHQKRVFLLNSGEGHLCVVDLANGKLTTVAALPGYTRGLAFFGRFAFVGLSRIRESNIFGGLPITERLPEAERKCGVVVVDLVTGQLVASLFFEAGCTELFDLQVLPGMRFPTVVGFQDQTLDGILIAPPTAWQAGGVATSGAAAGATAEERR